ncbi:helicase-related protein [Azoarcus sp. KH32C]|uniref:helicase-related protein n=1 Tax=Azoarcus sp. KH32C TaxID=748247 RepID=UPI0002385EA3|nr:helicase-related protein [Azoarcus sp. KH32C]BAL23462.1 putative type III restriction protein, res subunit [Azoarcus sp. KH32C]
MKQNFRGWEAAGRVLETLADSRGLPNWPLNEGQCASLRGIRARLPANGVVIADEVGMGKTRIAVALARSVVEAGGRVAILVPPGLGFQWRDELRDGGVEVPELLRSLEQYLAAWAPDRPLKEPWFDHEVVLLSHAFTNWRLSEGSRSWRWAVLPTLYAHWRKLSDGRFPRNFVEHKKLDDTWVQGMAKGVAEAIHRLPRSSPASRIICELAEQTPWPAALDGAQYRRGENLRPWLERAVGLGLGVFDLVIIDEAHKSRGDESGLSRMLDGVVLVSDEARRLAMTATPVELDVSQWHQTLERIGVDASSLSGADGDIFEHYASASARVRQCPGKSEVREAYQRVAARFQEVLSSYLLRRDKREAPCVAAFAKRSGLPIHAYRQEREVIVDTLRLSPAWRQAVCAAEALSIVSHQADDSFSKRLRLTMGSGHGIASLLDHVRRDAKLDERQLALDGDAMDATHLSLADKRLQRSAWWREVISSAFSDTGDPLHEHPALLAAVDAIEEVTRSGEKVLVFGRFTLPLQALVTLLNAREMLRTLDAGGQWAQAKVHEDEWPALQAAHRQLGRAGELDRAALDLQLERQYRELENRRRERRSGLLGLLDAGLPPQGKPRQIFEAFRRANEQHAGRGESPLALVTRVMDEITGTGLNDAPAQNISAAFAELIDAVCERGEGDEDGNGLLDAWEAANLWTILQTRLEDEFNRPEGGFARLMYGGTKPETRRLLQLAFNRPYSNPRVLVAQSVVGREGLNLHKACKTVVLLHPEWNPGVVEQQIGRVDRVGSLWEAKLEESPLDCPADALPRILVRPVVFKGTYDEKNWEVLRGRWDDLRAQLHGVVISPRLSESLGIAPELVGEINRAAPRFSPMSLALCPLCGHRAATTYREIHDIWKMKSSLQPACPECAAKPQEWMT